MTSEAKKKLVAYGALPQFAELCMKAIERQEGMKAEEILAMEAGRELDRLVAVYVMGWTKPRLLENRVNDYRLEPPDCKMWLEAPAYSTDIAKAFEVIAHWRNPRCEGGYGEVWIRSEGPAEAGFWVVELGVKAHSTATSLPLAICRAALLAVVAKEQP